MRISVITHILRVKNSKQINYKITSVTKNRKIDEPNQKLFLKMHAYFSSFVLSIRIHLLEAPNPPKCVEEKKLK